MLQWSVIVWEFLFNVKIWLMSFGKSEQYRGSFSVLCISDVIKRNSRFGYSKLYLLGVLCRIWQSLIFLISSSLYVNAHRLLLSFVLWSVRRSYSTSAVEGLRFIDSNELPLLVKITIMARPHLFISNCFYFIWFLNRLRLEKRKLGFILSNFFF